MFKRGPSGKQEVFDGVADFSECMLSPREPVWTACCIFFFLWTAVLYRAGPYVNYWVKVLCVCLCFKVWKYMHSSGSPVSLGGSILSTSIREAGWRFWISPEVNASGKRRPVSVLIPLIPVCPFRPTLPSFTSPCSCRKHSPHIWIQNNAVRRKEGGVAHLLLTACRNPEPHPSHIWAVGGVDKLNSDTLWHAAADVGYFWKDAVRVRCTLVNKQWNYQSISNKEEAFFAALCRSVTKIKSI